MINRIFNLCLGDSFGEFDNGTLFGEYFIFEKVAFYFDFGEKLGIFS